MHAASARLGLPHVGLGVGLRAKHFPYLMEHGPRGIDWLEIISENFIDNHGYARHVLERLRAESRPRAPAQERIAVVDPSCPQWRDWPR